MRVMVLGGDRAAERARLMCLLSVNAAVDYCWGVQQRMLRWAQGPTRSPGQHVQSWLYFCRAGTQLQQGWEFSHPRSLCCLL